MQCAAPIRPSASVRRTYGPVNPAPRAFARVSMTAKPIPNSSENRVQNLPRNSTYTSQSTQWSMPVVPATMPLSRSASARPKNSTFIRKMPSRAKPRTTSRSGIRSRSATGLNNVVVLSMRALPGPPDETPRSMRVAQCA